MRVRAKVVGGNEGAVVGYYDHRRWRAGAVFEMRVKDMTPIPQNKVQAFVDKGFFIIEPLESDKENGFCNRALPSWVEPADETAVSSVKQETGRKPRALSAPSDPVRRAGRSAEVNTGKPSGDEEVI